MIVKKTDFSSLSEDDKAFIKALYVPEVPQVDKANQMFKRFGIAWRTAQRWFTDLGLTNKLQKPQVIIDAETKEFKSAGIHLYTWAQNATPIHPAAWANMLAYAEALGAEVHVIPGRHTNPTSIFKDLDKDFWAPELIPYLDLTRHDITPHLRIVGDVKIVPTAISPLLNIATITEGKTAILGHPKMQLMCVPVLEGYHKQNLWTTGSITVPNGTDSLAGKRGESQHMIGFTIVELDGDSHHIRHVPICEDGSFTDICYHVSEGLVGRNDKMRAIAVGDLHHGQHSVGKMESTVGLMQHITPEYVILHDVFNGTSVNHHEQKNPLLLYWKYVNGTNIIQAEVDGLLDYIKELSDDLPTTQMVVVRSNHDIWLDRRVVEMAWQKDVPNAAFYHKAMGILLREENQKGLIPHFVKEHFDGDVLPDGRPKVIALGRDESFAPGEVEYGNHGDLGANGSRGNIKQYAKSAMKTTVGDYHTPQRFDGAMSAGTSTELRQGYNQGPSSWRWADVIEYTNGKSSHILYDDNFRFTTLFDNVHSNSITSHSQPA